MKEPESTTITSRTRHAVSGWIVVVLDGGEIRTLLLPEEGEIEIGRSERCYVCLKDERASRQHAVLHIRPEGASITDRGSRHGTVVDGTRLISQEPTPLLPGVVAQIGDATVVLQRRGALEPGARPVVQTSVAMGHLVEPPTDSPMHRVLNLARQIARDQAPVMLLGETGTGKEILAETIQRSSGRTQGPFIRVHCGAVPEHMFESELFGHESGAFTGASHARQGLIETANHGTLFLDELGELPLVLQPKLLRVLEDGSLRRVGGRQEIPVDVRFVVATNRDLDEEVAQGRFREDLMHRLDVLRIHVPPLRARTSEILPLAHTFVARACEIRDRPILVIGQAAEQALLAHRWPGNVRELRNAMVHAVLVCEGDRIEVEDLPIGSTRARPPSGSRSARSADPADAERNQILDALSQAAWNQTRAAEILGISRRTMLRRLDQLRIERPRKK